jgi:hypothetical protein
MTYRTRSPYAVLPASDVSRVLFPHRQVLRDAYASHGSHGLAVVLRDVLRPRFSGRAGHPAEAQLLGEALNVEVEDAVEEWRARFDGRRPDDGQAADPVAAYLAPDDPTPEEVEAVRETFRSNLLRRLATGGTFRECPECSTWFAPERVRAAADAASTALRVAGAGLDDAPRAPSPTRGPRPLRPRRGGAGGFVVLSASVRLHSK